MEICQHIKIFKKAVKKKSKRDDILIEVTCKACGHKWKIMKETAPVKNEAWNW